MNFICKEHQQINRNIFFIVTQVPFKVIQVIVEEKVITYDGGMILPVLQMRKVRLSIM